MTAASLKQGKQILDLLSGMTTEAVQNLIRHGDLVKMLAQADITRIDPVAFAAALNPPAPQPQFDSASGYVSSIMARSKLRGWGFTQEQADNLFLELDGHHHAGPLAPISVRMWLGRDLEYNWNERISWLKDIVSARGLDFRKYFDATPSFQSGSAMSGEPSLRAVGLDLSIWDKKSGLVPNEIRPLHHYWPSLEVPDLICLNPSLIHFMNGESLPYMMAPGFVLDDADIPVFRYGGHEFAVNANWENAWLNRTAIVFAREL